METKELMEFKNYIKSIKSIKSIVKKENILENNENNEKDFEDFEDNTPWTKEELIDFINDLQDDEAADIGNVIFDYIMYNDEINDYDSFVYDDYDDYENIDEAEKADEEIYETKFFDVKKRQLAQQKKKHIADKKRKAKLLHRYYQKNKARIARAHKIYRKKAKRNPSKIRKHKA